MYMKKLLFLFTLFTLSFFILAPSTFAQQSTESATYLRDQYEFLKEQAVHHEQRVDRERETFYSQIAIGLGLLTLFGIGSYGAAVWSINRKAKKVFREHIQKNSTKLEQKAEEWAKNAFRSELGLQKSIVLVAKTSQHSEIEENELKLLRTRGFQNVTIKKPTDDVTGYDMVVFYYNDDLDSNLTRIVESLEKQSAAVPILAYYNGRVPNQKLTQYRWHTFANSPLTLISWIFTIASSFDSLVVEEEK
jgi:hypothetical protein